MTEYRFEFKYLTDISVARKAEALISSYGMTADPINPTGEYHVTSLYFDNFHLRDYYNKSGGFLRRKKIRARVYEKDFGASFETVWMETKERHDAETKKTRSKLSLDEWRELLTLGSEKFWQIHKDKVEEDGALRYILGEMIKAGRSPKVFVRYQRKAYQSFYNDSKVRITFDQEMEAREVVSGDKFFPLYLQGGSWYTPRWFQFEPQRVIMEIKFSSVMPPWFGELVRFLEVERISISKYARGVEVS
ncbi:MAG: polyphosphate polymerase domain-containing protein, partial [bacterium]|nr:polyphosphate polymerase domain-containing protein [bacterium]